MRRVVAWGCEYPDGGPYSDADARNVLKVREISPNSRVARSLEVFFAFFSAHVPDAEQNAKCLLADEGRTAAKPFCCMRV